MFLESSGAGKIIGILTEDSRLFFDLVKVLKARKLEFRSLEFDSSINFDIGVVLTSEEELASINFQPNIAVPDAYQGVRMAIQALCSEEKFKEIIIGIDPGKYPGIAVLANGEIIESLQANSMSQCTKIVADMLEVYCYERSRLRIGHGAPESRDQIINKVSQLFSVVEIVDESSTTKHTKTPDIDAAIAIAKSSGHMQRITN